MKCNYCSAEIPEGTAFCPQCTSPAGRPATIPEGYLLDSGSGLYYHSEFVTEARTGKQLQRVIWLNPTTGIFTPVVYDGNVPVENVEIAEDAPSEKSEDMQASSVAEAQNTQQEGFEQSAVVISEPEIAASYDSETEIITEPEGPIASEQQTEIISEAAIPEGFDYDADSGWYYKSSIGNDPQTGAPAQVVDWYDHSRGSHTLRYYPLAHEPAVIPEPEIATAYDSETEIITESESPAALEQQTEIISESAIPEGFDYDADSGWYYKSSVGNDPQTGLPAQVVDWYDHTSGKHATRYYPLTDEEAASDSSDDEGSPLATIPEGFELDADSGWYYKSSIGNDPQTGAPAQVVDWYNPSSCSHTQKYYPIDAQPAQDEEEKPKRASKAKKTLLIIFLIVVLLAAAIAALFISGIISNPFSQQPVEKPVSSSSTGPTASNSASASSAPASSMPASSNISELPEINDLSPDPQIPGPNPSIVLEPEAEPPMPDGKWPAFAHISEFYSRAQSDNEHLYILQPTKDPLEDITRSGLIRIAHGTESVERIFAPGTLNAILSFALHEDYIYFCAYLNTDYCGYYRIPKSGGVAEFLFLEEFSNIVNYNDSLYMLFAESGDLGIYSPESDSEPMRYSVCTQQQLADMPEFCKDFSVYENELYFGYADGDGSGFSKISLSDFQITKLAQTPMPAKNVFIQGDSLLYAQYNEDEEFIDYYKMSISRELAADYARSQMTDISRSPLLVRIGNTIIFQVDSDLYTFKINDPRNQEYFYMADDNLSDYSAYPFAITEEYLLYPNYALSIETGQSLSYELQSSLEVNVGSAMNRAKKALEEREFAD